MLTQFARQAGPSTLLLPPATITKSFDTLRSNNESETMLIGADGPAPSAPIDPRLRAAQVELINTCAKLAAEYGPKIGDLVADRAIRGGRAEYRRREANAKNAAQEYGAALNAVSLSELVPKWLSNDQIDVMSRQVSNIEKAKARVDDLLHALGGKPLTDEKEIKAFREAVASAAGLDPMKFEAHGNRLTKEVADSWIDQVKLKWIDDHYAEIPFRLLALSGDLGSRGKPVEFTTRVPDDVRKLLALDPNLAARRDKALAEMSSQFWDRAGVLEAFKHESSSFGVAKRVLETRHLFTMASKSLLEADQLMEVAVRANLKDWQQTDSYPEFKKVWDEWSKGRQKAGQLYQTRLTEIEGAIQAENAARRAK